MEDKTGDIAIEELSGLKPKSSNEHKIANGVKNCSYNNIPW